MKKLNNLFLCVLFCAILSFDACKSKFNENANAPVTTNTVDSSPAPAPAPVIVSGDEELKKGVADATKDYPTVKAEVADSVINLTGEIKRADWQRLNPTLNTLHPKRINSENLTIK